MTEERQSRYQIDRAEINMYSLIRDVLRHLWMVILVATQRALLTAVYSAEQYVPSYTSKAVLVVSSKDSGADVFDNLDSAKEVAQVFERVLRGELLQKRVAEKLEIDSFPAKVSAAAVEETNMVELDVMAESPQMAFMILRTILNTYQEVTDYVVVNVILEELQPPVIPVRADQELNVRPVMKKVFLMVLAAGIGLCALISYQMDTIKSEGEVEKKLDTTLIESIYHEKKRYTLKERIFGKKHGILITDPVVSFGYAETFKKIREKVSYRLAKNGGKVILVTSVRENEGKSTVAANLALSLVEKNKTVLLVDADLRKPSQYKIFEHQIEEESEIGAFLKGTSTFEKILQEDYESGMNMIIGSRSYPEAAEMAASEKMKEILKEAEKIADYVIVDSSPMMWMADSELLADYADGSILVVRQGCAFTRDINDAIDRLEDTNSKLLGCIYNDVHSYGVPMVQGYGRYGYGKYGRYGRYGEKQSYSRINKDGESNE